MKLKEHLPHLRDKDSLSSYLKKIHTFPVLEAEEEFKLAKDWHEKQDPQAMDLLMKSHLRLVSRIAQGYRGYGLPLQDLISEGSIGIIQAIKRFEPEKGFRFSTYARWWIRATIQDYILRNWSLVRIGTTATQKKLFFKLRSIKEKLEKEHSTHSLELHHIKKIAQELEVSETEVVNMYERLAGAEYSLNSVINHEEQEEWQDWIVDETQDIELNLSDQEELQKRRKIFEDALKGLNPREYSILRERRFVEPPKTLEEVSQQYQISRERVRQIEVSAFNKLQKEVRNKAAQDYFLN